MNGRHCKAFLILLAPIFGLVGAYSQTLTTSNLPIIVIDTQGNDIPDEPKIAGHMGIIDNGPGNVNSISDPFNEWDGAMAIELRGSTSQLIFEKKSYGVELKTQDGTTDSSAVIFGMGREEDWVLHGPYSDKTLIRNVLTFHLWEATGRYGSATRLCELVINHEYKGVYVFMEKVKRDGDRVDISKLDPDENSGDDLTGGYIIKIDKFDGSNSGAGFESNYLPPGRIRDEQIIYYQFDYPKGRDITTTQGEYIQSFMAAFEDALAGPNYRDPVLGYARYIDVESFVDYAVLMEVTRNIDAYRLSTFMYKDRDSKDGRLKMGPPWDFNLAFGNADYCEGFNTEGWAWDFNTVCADDFWLTPFWWDRLLQDESFVTLFKMRWNELRASSFQTEQILTFIDEQAAVLQDPEQRNRSRWPEVAFYIWPNPYVGNSYLDDVEYMKDWIATRMEWLDQAIAELNVVTAVAPEIPDPSFVEIFPNPAKSVVSIRGQSRLDRARIFSFNGKLMLDQPMTGFHQQLDIQSLPQGAYLVRVVAEGRVVTKVLLVE